MNDKIEKEVVTLPPFKRMCMTIGELPSSYLETMTYYEMLVWFTKYLGETIIPTINNNGEAVTELQGLFTELQNYVNNYFDNLDVQEEINNKLDEMAQDGTLEEMVTHFLEINCVLAFDTLNDLKNANNLIDGSITKTLGKINITDEEGAFYKIRTLTSADVIDNNLIVPLNNYNNLIAQKVSNLKRKLEFYSLQKSTATQIIKFPNGKTMFIDTGTDTNWEDIRTAIAILGINKFDYGIITHFHPDHYGNIQNFIDNYDLTNCQVFIQMKPDYTNHSEDIGDPESLYDSQVNLLRQNGIEPIVPENDTYIEVTKDCKIRFLNTSQTIANNYYGRESEYYTDGKVGFNDFSLITEIIFKDTKILTCGDIEKPVEEQYTSYLGKENIILMPHHGVNQDAYLPFYDAIKPDYAICNFVTSDDNWIGIRHKGFMKVKNDGAYLVTYRWNTCENYIFRFISDGKDIVTNVKDGSLGSEAPNLPYQKGQLYRQIDEIINFTTPQYRETITLNELISNMNLGSKLTILWLQEYNERYAQLYSDIMAIFPKFYYAMIVEIERINDQHDKITIHNQDLTFTAYRQGTLTDWRINGYGKTPSLTETNLVSYIKGLPIGNYICGYFKDSTNTDMGNSSYVLSINIIETNTNLKASLTATQRTTASGTLSTARFLVGYAIETGFVLEKVI